MVPMLLLLLSMLLPLLHRCREMSLSPFLRLQARLEGLPVEQLDMHMARQVAEELGLGYAPVGHQAAAGEPV